MAAQESNALLAASPIEIYEACSQVFEDEDWLTFEPETLLHALKEDVSDLSADKLLAVQACAVNGSLVLTHAQAFEKVVNAFCNNVCVMDTWQPPFVEELCYAVGQIRELLTKTHPGEDPEFGGEIPEYVAAAAKYRGWFVLPKPLAFAQERLDFLTGINDKSQRYKDNQAFVDGVRRITDTLTPDNAKALLDDPDLGKDPDDPKTIAVTQLIGALLYDPTLPYSDGQHPGG